jgi:hypothetical protein
MQINALITNFQESVWIAAFNHTAVGMFCIGLRNFRAWSHKHEVTACTLLTAIPATYMRLTLQVFEQRIPCAE